MPNPPKQLPYMRRFPNTHLIVGCCNDAVTHAYKGKTVFTDTERYESLRHCKCVFCAAMPCHPARSSHCHLLRDLFCWHDCANICFSHNRWVDEIVTDAPWVITEDFINKHKIDYVTHDALPYTDTSGLAGGADVYDFVRPCPFAECSTTTQTRANLPVNACWVW